MTQTDKQYSRQEVDIALIAKDMAQVKETVRDIKSKLDADYVTRTEFEIVQKIVYGMVGVVLLGVLGAVIKLIII